MNFTIPHQNLNCVYYFLPFKLLYKDIIFLDISGNNKDFAQSRLRDYVLTSFRNPDKVNDRNLSKEERTALNDLTKNKDVAIKRTDKLLGQ